MQGAYLEDLEIGQTAELRRTVTEHDIEAFAEVTGDENPVHLDEAYAAATQFKGRIAHGMLSAGYISAVLGTQLPGPGAIYVSQTLNFRRPVRIGDEVTAEVKVTSIDPAPRPGHLRHRLHGRRQDGGRGRGPSWWFPSGPPNPPDEPDRLS